MLLKKMNGMDRNLFSFAACSDKWKKVKVVSTVTIRLSHNFWTNPRLCDNKFPVCVIIKLFCVIAIILGLLLGNLTLTLFQSMNSEP